MVQEKVGAGRPPTAVQVRIISTPSCPDTSSAIVTDDTGTENIKDAERQKFNYSHHSYRSHPPVCLPPKHRLMLHVQL